MHYDNSACEVLVECVLLMLLKKLRVWFGIDAAMPILYYLLSLGILTRVLILLFDRLARKLYQKA